MGRASAQTVEGNQSQSGLRSGGTQGSSFPGAPGESSLQSLLLRAPLSLPLLVVTGSSLPAPTLLYSHHWILFWATHPSRNGYTVRAKKNTHKVLRRKWGSPLAPAFSHHYRDRLTGRSVALQARCAAAHLRASVFSVLGRDCAPLTARLRSVKHSPAS